MYQIDSINVEFARDEHVKYMKITCGKLIEKYLDVIRECIERKSSIIVEGNQEVIRRISTSLDVIIKKNKNKNSKIMVHGSTPIKVPYEINIKDVDDVVIKNLEHIYELLLGLYYDYEGILGDKPDELKLYQKKYSNSKPNVSLKNKIIAHIFSYGSFTYRITGYTPYTLCKNLDITICPYCNRSYIKRVLGVKNVKGKSKHDLITRAQLDHFLPKSNNQVLALSFYNLIPACGICNSIKGKKTKEHLHPYLDEPNIKFRIDGLIYTVVEEISKKKIFSGSYDIKINCDGCKKSEGSVEVFKLEEVYNEHKEIVEDMYKFSEKYTNKYESALMVKLGIKSNSNEFTYLKERAHGLVDKSYRSKIPMSYFRKAVYDKLEDLKK